MLLEAELPSNVRAGEELRLEVRELTPEKVVLAIKDESQPPPATLVETPRVPLPGGGFLKVAERDAGGPLAAGDRTHTLTLRYDAPTIGSGRHALHAHPGGARADRRRSRRAAVRDSRRARIRGFRRPRSTSRWQRARHGSTVVAAQGAGRGLRMKSAGTNRARPPRSTTNSARRRRAWWQRVSGYIAERIIAAARRPASRSSQTRRW